MQFGEFNIDPSTVPEPPQVPLGQDLTFEVVAVQRKEYTTDEGRNGTRIELQLQCIDVPGATVFHSFFPPRYRSGSAHKNWYSFLLLLGHDIHAQAESVVRSRFRARAERDVNDYVHLAKILGLAQ